MNSALLEDRQVFIISDGTGITAQHLAHSLMSQFENIDFITTTLPYIDNIEKAHEAVLKVNQAISSTGEQPIVFETLINPEIRSIINSSNAHLYDLFHAFLAPLEKVLDKKCSYTMGRAHGVTDLELYQKRIDAVHYTLDHDDGIKLRGYNKADIIIVGVSRCGKTPTSIYLAMQCGLRVANYPLTEDDASFRELPECLKEYKNKIFGLTISSEKLYAIRQERLPNSDYASKRQCQKEINNVEKMFTDNNIPFINSTFHSIEEISTRMLDSLDIERNAI